MYRQMRYFIAVVETNSFFEAGELCHISQSAISQQIKALESELQVDLLERHGRKFTITPAGQYFYQQAKRQIAETDALIREVRRIGKGEQQRLRVGVLNGFSNRIMQQAVDTFAETHPNVTLTLSTGTHEEIFQQLIAGQLDMAINDQRRALSDQFVNEFLADQAVYALMRQTEREHAGSGIELADLAELLCVCVTGGALREVEVSFWRDAVNIQSDILFAGSIDAALLNIAAGIAFLPCDEDMAVPAGCVHLPILRNGTPLTRKMYAFWPESVDSSLQWEFSDAVRRAIK